MQGVDTCEEERKFDDDIISSYKKIMNWCEGVLLRNLAETSRCVFLQILYIYRETGPEIEKNMTCQTNFFPCQILFSLSF